MNNQEFLKRYRTNKNATWIKVKLSSGEEFFFSKYDEWKIIKTLCSKIGSHVVEFFLQFRSHEIEIDVKDADGVYFVRSIMGQFGGDTKHYYTVGVINGDNVYKKMFIIPELVAEKEYEDDLESCFAEGIIYNVKKKKENR